MRMTPRERVLTALRHKEADRVPLDLGGTESSGLHAIAAQRLRRCLHLTPRPVRIYDTAQQVAHIDDDLRAVLKPDTVVLFPEPRRWKPWTQPDGTPCQIPELWNPESEPSGDTVVRNSSGIVVARLPKDGFYFESTVAPLASVESPHELDRFRREIESFDWPFYADESPDDFAARAKRLHDETGLAVVANLMCHLLAAGQILRGYADFMIDLIANKPLAHALLERLTDAYVRRCDDLLRRAGPAVDVVLFNDDLGTQRGPMLSLETYREMIWPYQRRLFAAAKKSGAFLLFHSCGAVRAFIPSLIEAGVDALNPVQVSAEGMNTAELKREFGRDLVFWGGGCDTQRVLRGGAKGEIEEEVRRRVADLAPGGGFVFTQVHNIQPDVPPENILAMLEAFETCRGYG